MANTVRQYLSPFVTDDVVDAAETYIRWTKTVSGSDIKTLTGDVKGNLLPGVWAFADDVLRVAFVAGAVRSDDAINAYYEKATDEMFRPLGVSGHDTATATAMHIGKTFVTCGVSERVTVDDADVNPASFLDTLAAETCDGDAVVSGESCRFSVAQLRNACERADASGRSSFVETLDAIGSVEWNDDKAQPNLSQLARHLNRSIPTVRERWTHLQAFITSDRFGQLSAE